MVDSKITNLTALTSADSADVLPIVDVDVLATKKITVANLAASISITESQISDLGSYQPADADLSALAGLTTAADKVPYFTGSGAADLADLTSFGRTLIANANSTDARVDLGTVIGTDVQAQDAFLQNIADLADPNAHRLLGWGDTTGAVQFFSGGTGITLSDSGIAVDATALTHTDLQDIGTNTHAQIDTHLASTSNPHSVTKAQVGLGNVENTQLSTWTGSANIATVAEGAVTAHQAALSITESQISDLGAYITGITGEPLSDLSDVTITTIASGELLKWNGTGWINNTLAEAGIAAASHTHATSDITSGTFADARIAESNVTQHQAALSITESQISDLAHSNSFSTIAVSGQSDVVADSASDTLTLAAGSNITITTNATTDTITIAASGGGGLSDADYGDITVSGTGTVMTIDNDVVTYAKMQNVSATNRILGRITTGAGDTEELTAANVRTIINVADGATANSSDATLLARANHTGTQTMPTISDAGSLATLSSVNNSNWSGTDLAVVNGGTGASDAATARSNLSAASTSQVFGVPFTIVTVADGDYRITTKMPFAGTITETTSISSSGTCTATFKINTTDYGENVREGATAATYWPFLDFYSETPAASTMDLNIDYHQRGGTAYIKDAWTVSLQTEGAAATFMVPDTVMILNI